MKRGIFQLYENRCVNVAICCYPQERQRVDEARRRLQSLERQHFEFKQKIETSPREEQEELQALARRDSIQLDSERKKFEDLEFRQLEIEARIEGGEGDAGEETISRGARGAEQDGDIQGEQGSWRGS